MTVDPPPAVVEITTHTHVWLVQYLLLSSGCKYKQGNVACWVLSTLNILLVPDSKCICYDPHSGHAHSAKTPTAVMSTHAMIQCSIFCESYWEYMYAFTPYLY